MNKITATLCLLLVLTMGCKKDKPEMINFTVAINVQDGVSYTVYRTGNTSEFFRVHEGKSNASTSFQLSAEKWKNLNVKITTTDPNDPEFEMIITKENTQTVIFHQKAKNTIEHSFIAE